jgi:nitroreductase
MEGQVEYEELLGFLQTRRTVRALKPDPLSADLVEKMLEAARWAPTGFNMQPQELLVVRDPELQAELRKIIDGCMESDFALEVAREAWQGPTWTPGPGRRIACPIAPIYVLVLGDQRRRVGLPMNVRYERQKSDSIFEASLSNALLCLWLAAHSLGLGVQPVSAVKNGRGQCLVKHLLNLPEHIYLYEMLAVGYPAPEAAPRAKLLRHLDEIVHYDRVSDDAFMGDEQLKKQIRKLRAGNVARHVLTEDEQG